MVAPAVEIQGERLSVHFSDFGQESYQTFLRMKRLPEYELEYLPDETYRITAPARFAAMLGVQDAREVRHVLPLSSFLFDDQDAIVRMALKAKRFACWANCGLGKTLIGLEFARQVVAQTGGRFLIFTLNDLVGQWLDMAAEFYGESLPILRITSREQMRDFAANGYRGHPGWKYWERRKDGDPTAFRLYRRHYSAKKNPRPKIKQFVGPGQKEVLLSKDGQAVFAWRKFIDDSGQTGVNCATFRNESATLSSDMIREAMEVAWERWPGQRLYTYVDADEIESANPGYCFKQAGWKYCGKTAKGLHILEAHPPRIAITNYEKMNYRGKGGDGEQVVNELRYLAGMIVDENRLKAGGGKQKWAIIHSSKGIEFKLSLTATPAPNDIMEYASQASFLEKMRSEGEIIWTYFQRDEKTHRWSVRPHARKGFFEFMAGWSIYVRDPRRYGWRNGFPDVPKPVMIRHDIAMTEDQRKALQKLTRTASGQMSLIDKNDRNAIERNKLSQVAKGFIYVKRGADGKLKASKSETKKIVRIPSLKPEFVARLFIAEMAAGYKPLLWTVFDAESDLIIEELHRLGCKDFDSLHGKHNAAQREATLKRYRSGESPGLITKGALLGWGMNFQFCKSMIFSGFDDSYEKWFQQIARAVRYGQTDGVRVHMPVIEELEGDMLENLMIKQDKHEAAIVEMEEMYIAASKVTGALAA